MLRELPKVRQNEGEDRRRWFNDDYFDLIVWFNDIDDITGFQLCYGSEINKKALTWKNKMGYTHETIDDGDSISSPGKSSPILLAEGFIDKSRIAQTFLEASQEMDNKVAGFVNEKISIYENKL